MQIDIMSFTRRGIELSEKMQKCFSSLDENMEVVLYTKYSKYQKTSYAGEKAEWSKEQDCAAGSDKSGWKTEDQQLQKGSSQTSRKCQNPIYVRESIYDWMRTRFEQNRNGTKTAVIWIGACGIAVRAMAPSLRDKLTDIPVLVADEAGQFVIPVLSGHYGGANKLAGLIADRMGAVPVITTATDVNGAFAVDVFAKENHLLIQNKEKIAEVSSKVLDGKKIVMLADGQVEGKTPEQIDIYNMTAYEEKAAIMRGLNEPPNCLPVEQIQKEDQIKLENRFMPDVLISAKYQIRKEIILKSKIVDDPAEYQTSTYPLWLIPRTIILGMGCKKGKSSAEIELFVLETLAQEQIALKAVAALATIDLKKEEPGFLEFAKKYGLEFLTYPKEVLKEVPGEFCSSAFVAQTVGVDNVCERAALAACADLFQKEEKPGMQKKYCNGQTEKENPGKQNPDMLNCDSGKNQDQMPKRGRLLLRKKAKDGMTLAIAEREWSVKFDET